MTDSANQDKEKQTEKLMDAIGKLLTDANAEDAIIIFRLPGDKNQEMFRSMTRGHFYDTLTLTAEYARKAKSRIVSDLQGLMSGPM